MATECRGKKTPVNLNKIVKVEAYAVLASLAIGGFTIGRATAPTKTKVLLETVEVPTYSKNTMPTTVKVHHFNVPLSKGLQRYIYEICADEGVPVTLVLAMIEQGSGFDADMVSSSGDYGLMQISTVNRTRLSAQFGNAKTLDPYQNVFCGIKIMSSLLGSYENYEDALLAYDLGDYGAIKAHESGITSTEYTRAVLKSMKKYEAEVKAYAAEKRNG